MQVNVASEPGARWMALNGLSLVDYPGEYYIDRDEGVMFIYPQDVSDLNHIYVSHSTAIFSGESLQHIAFKNLTLSHARHTPIVFINATGILLNGVHVIGHGGNGTLLDGTDNAITSSKFEQLACMGVSVSGGNRNSLSKGNNVVSNSHILDYAMWKRTYQAGIFWAGVGNSYMTNIIENGPHNAILGGGNEADLRGGNDCVFLGNIIRNVAYETSDTGAFCMLLENHFVA